MLFMAAASIYVTKTHILWLLRLSPACVWLINIDWNPQEMSHHSDDQLLQAGSESFWEPGNYKRTTKRIEDGYKWVDSHQGV